MNTEFFLGEIIVESLAATKCLDSIQVWQIKTRIEERPEEMNPRWHIHRYRLPRTEVTKVAPLIKESLSSGAWYVHFFAETTNELFVIMKDRIFTLPKFRDKSWDEMIRHGESVGVGRKWTESIPINLPP
jgi:hypothetical protein